MFERPFLSVWHSWLIFIWTFFHFPLLLARVYLYPWLWSWSTLYLFVCVCGRKTEKKLHLNLQNRNSAMRTKNNSNEMKAVKEYVHRWCAACSLNADDRQNVSFVVDCMCVCELHKIAQLHCTHTHPYSYAISREFDWKRCKITSWSNIVLFYLHSVLLFS